MFKQKMKYNKISKAFKEAGYELYMVGGCVRDFYLGIKPHDIDFATNATPEIVKSILSRDFISYTNVGERFGTIVARIDNEEFEITTYRKETGYADGRHPDKIDFAKTIEEDLARRDFTMNAMAMNPDTMKIVDPFGGIKDIDRKVVTAVGDANLRFKEDSLRILRALRFSIKYGFDIDSNTKDAMLQNKEELRNISKERITDELKKILTSGKPVSKYFKEFSDIVFEIIPELKPCYKFDQKSKWHKHDVYEHILAVVDGCKTIKFEVKLAALLHDIGKPSTFTLDDNGYGHFYGHPEKSYEISQSVISNTLRLTNKEKDEVLTLVRFHDAPFACTEKSARRAMQKFGIEYVRDFTILRQSDRDDHINLDSTKMPSIPDFLAMCEEIEKSNTCLSLKTLNINGDDLINLGYEKGPDIGKELNFLLDLVVSGCVENDRRSLVTLAKEDLLEKTEDMEADL